jgi:hypothetical protein
MSEGRQALPLADFQAQDLSGRALGVHEKWPAANLAIEGKGRLLNARINSYFHARPADGALHGFKFFHDKCSIYTPAWPC